MFAYSREAPIKYVMSVRVSVPPRVSSRLPLYTFPLNVLFRTSVKICQQPLNLDIHGSVHRIINLIERTNKMQPCSRIYYSNVS